MVKKTMTTTKKHHRNENVLCRVWQKKIHLQFEVPIGGYTESEYGSIQKDEQQDQTIYYLKIHAPIETLYDCAEDLKMKMPTKESDIQIKEWYQDIGLWKFVKQIDIFRVRNPEIHEGRKYFVLPFEINTMSFVSKKENW